MTTEISGEGDVQEIPRTEQVKCEKKGSLCSFNAGYGCQAASR